MKIKEAIDFLQQIKYSNVYTPKKYQHEIENIQALLKEKQELVTTFSKEGDEYQKKLDNIDFRAMNIQELVKEIREMV